MAAPSASVVVPATSANLGCAFDCAGIALNLYLRAEAVVTSSPGLVVSYAGADAGEIPKDARNLVFQALERATRRLGGPAFTGPEVRSGLQLDLRNEIPLGVGLGSSAAAIVAGTLLGAELAGARL